MAAGSPLRLRLGRPVRIRQNREFARVRAEGRRLASGCLVANWRPVAAGSRSRLGVISSGSLGSAVARNRARRLLREVFRRHQHELAQPVDLVLIARQSIVGKGLAEVERDFLNALQKAKLCS